MVDFATFIVETRNSIGANSIHDCIDLIGYYNLSSTYLRFSSKYDFTCAASPCTSQIRRGIVTLICFEASRTVTTNANKFYFCDIASRRGDYQLSTRENTILVSLAATINIQRDAIFANLISHLLTVYGVAIINTSYKWYINGCRCKHCWISLTTLLPIVGFTFTDFYVEHWILCISTWILWAIDSQIKCCCQITTISSCIFIVIYICCIVGLTIYVPYIWFAGSHLVVDNHWLVDSQVKGLNTLTTSCCSSIIEIFTTCFVNSTMPLVWVTSCNSISLFLRLVDSQI